MRRAKKPFLVALVFWGLLLAALGGEILAIDPEKSLTKYLIDRWSTQSGLPHDSILSIAQTDEGYLWFGTYEGLVRFDGVSFTQFNKVNTPEFQNNGVMALLTDKAGNLWIGTPNGLLRYRDERFTLYTKKSGLVNDFILSIYEDHMGDLWIGTTHGMNRFSSSKFYPYTREQGFFDGHVTSFCETNDGALWIGTENGGLFQMNKGVFTNYGPHNGLPAPSVCSLALDINDRLWVGTFSGLFVMESDGRFQAACPDTALGRQVIRSLYRDRYGSMWIGTEETGLACWRDGGLSFLDSKKGLSGDYVRALFEDREGSLWIGTYNNGISRLKNSRFSVYGTRNGLPSDLVRCVMADRDGKIWIGTLGGGVACVENDRISVHDKTTGLPSNRVVSLAQSPDGTIWLGTYGKGIVSLKDGKYTGYSTENGLSNDIVRAIMVEPDGTVWAGTNGGGINIIRNGRISVLNTGNGLSDDFIYCIVRDNRHNIWVGAYNGTLMQIRDGRVTVYDERKGLSRNAIWAIYPDSQGAIWLGTNEGGLKYFFQGTFKTLSWKDGLMSDQIFQILEDGRNIFWMNTNRGIFSIPKRDLLDFMSGKLLKLTCRMFESAEGTIMLSSAGPAQPAGSKGKDGRLWFPTIQGAVSIDPDNNQTNPLPPTIVIESLTTRDATYSGAQPVTLDPGTERIEIHFTALSFLVPKNVRFRYMLEGFDTAWSAETSGRVAYYTNLPPGRYVFHVIACNNDGVWNTRGTSLEIVIRPFFYQTAWFIILCVALGTILAFFLHRLRLTSITRKQRELEAMVQRRTQELIHLNHELLEANKLRGELLNIAAHDLKNPLQAIQGYSELIQEKNPEDSTTLRYVGKISEASKAMVTLINDLLVTAKIEAGKIVFHAARVDLDKMVRDCTARHEDHALRKRQRLLVSGDNCHANCDPERTMEIIDNLLGNAIKYSPKGASIEIRTASNIDGSHVFVHVKDEGPGLSEDDLKRIFGKFQKLSAQPTGGETSTGLGLSISKCLAEMQKGNITVVNGPDEGATFTLELPGDLTPP